MRVHFEGEPDRFRKMRALFNQTSTLRVKWAAPIDRKFRLSRLQAAVNRILKGRAA